MSIAHCPACRVPGGRLHLGRRAVLGGLAAALALPGDRTSAETSRRRIDVHHHALPPDYVRLVGAETIGAPAPGGAVPSWSPEHSLAVMDRNGIETALLSVSAPGLWFGDAARCADLARICNDYMAQVRADRPARFGVFAALPLPDVDATLREMSRAFDDLSVDGVGLMTSYDGRYLGDPAFEPVLAELDRRRAVAYVHPTSVNCNRCLGELEIPASTLEFPFDTTRTIASLIYARALSRFPHIRFIFSHAGGALPFLSQRIARLATSVERYRDMGPDGPIAAMRRAHYDTALSANPIAMESLRALVGTERILFGTDYPFAPEASTAATVRGLADLRWEAADLRRVERENALSVFPRFR